MSRHLIRRLAVAGLMPGLGAACYTYTPIAALPEPDSHVAVVLSDYGRLEASRQIGPQAERVEGSVISTSDSGYLLAVSSVRMIQGNWVKWTGETVTMRREYVALAYRRDLSKSRTALVAAGTAAALTAIILGFDLFGIGNPNDTDPGGGDPGET